MDDQLARDAWARLLEVRAAAASRYETEVVAAIRTTGAPGHLLGMLIHAHDVDPEPLTVEGLLRCTPYYAAAAFRERMVMLAADGWFVSPAEGAYVLAPTGRDAIAHIEGAAESKLLALASACDPGDLSALDELVGRVAETTRTFVDIPDKGCLRATGNMRRKEHLSPLAAILQSIDTLEAFRCDGHRAIWRRSLPGGRAWELLTVMWQGQANSADSMFAWSQRQGFPRGFSATEYAEDLRGLVAHGWAVATAEADIYRLTEEGRQLRQEAEDATDANFYTPWSSLMPGEIADMHRLVTTLMAQLRS